MGKRKKKTDNVSLRKKYSLKERGREAEGERGCKRHSKRERAEKETERERERERL